MKALKEDPEKILPLLRMVEGSTLKGSRQNVNAEFFHRTYQQFSQISKAYWKQQLASSMGVTKDRLDGLDKSDRYIIRKLVQSGYGLAPSWHLPPGSHNKKLLTSLLVKLEADRSQRLKAVVLSPDNHIDAQKMVVFKLSPVCAESDNPDEHVFSHVVHVPTNSTVPSQDAVNRHKSKS